MHDFWLARCVSFGLPNAGLSLERAELQRLADLTLAAGAWLVVDDTYEYFVNGDQPHVCIGGPNVIHMFSLSKVRGF